MNSKNISVLYIVAAAMIWSTSYALTKMILPVVPAMMIGAIRFALATVILGAITANARKKLNLSSKEKNQIYLAGMVGVFIYFALENYGVLYATASDATLIVASYPILSLIAEWIFKKGDFNKIKLTGMIIAIAGVVLIVTSESTNVVINRSLGIVLLFLGGVAWTAYNMLASNTAKKSYSPLIIIYYQCLAGAIGFVLASVTEINSLKEVSLTEVSVLAYLAVFCSIIAFVLYNAGLKNVTSANAVNILNLVPVFGLFWAVVIAKETVTSIQLVGCMIVILGVYLSVYVGEARGVSKFTEAKLVKDNA
ncbi:DMT family transporter [Endozoicomonas sp. SM1973]|uniref:DMT family transporter n=1 Tax=Spartinivicinus marinus TaxID=2994442 RepID=A0A853IAQ0_9GAMM|nr:DMT family transporter [Spartinivicinus marinus]MCX4027515.1 DMT family transporter [Spartinivicinus marinus]NYZ68892.1 DMT family transporter [Spartinivicinus marinus]